MAAKLLHSLSEDRSDLQKQIGCMTGIFQLFDHQHILAGKRAAGKRLLLGNSRSDSGDWRRENSITRHGRSFKESTGNRSADEGQRLRVVAESSGASFSSSCSSSFSSMEFNRASLPEASSFDRIIFSRTPSRGHESLDLRDIVKDCMYREARTLPVKSNEERNRLSFEAINSAPKQKELPRLSLDGIEDSMKSISSSHLSRNLQSHVFSNEKVAQKRDPGVVAKLMGLEALPHSSLASNIASSKASLMKPIQSSKLPLKIAPWSQFDGDRSSSKPSLPANSSPSVYSEIEKRLTNIEFKQSGKDLRALKQIQNSASRNKQSNKVVRSTTREPYSSSVLESRIVVMKPASLIGKSNSLVSSVMQKGGQRRLPEAKSSASNGVLKDQSPRNSIRDSFSSTSGEKRPKSRKAALPQPSSKSQQLGRESSLGSVKISGSLSPRLQQKKPEPENRFRPPTPPHSEKPRRTSNVGATNWSAPGATSRRKSFSLLQSDDQLSEVRTASRSLSSTGDELSLLSDDNLSAYPKMNTKSIPSRLREKSSNLRCDEDDSPVIISPEHPSPVSVLDLSAYRDDELSPVKQISNTLEGDRALNGDNFFVEDQWRSPDDHLLPQSVASVPINHRKLQNIDNLVQNLRGLHSHHDDAKTGYIASLCENTNPDCRYISEIILASGLFRRDLTSGMKNFQLHPSGHPMNPELFFVLEGNNLVGVAEKSRRKLIFDVVNEILSRTLPNRVGSQTLTPQKLVKKLCCEIEQLRGESSGEEDDGLKNLLRADLTNREENWTDFHDEISGAVLEIERSIFKNLVDEIVASEGAYLRAKSGRRLLA